MSRPIEARISLPNLIHNLQQIKQYAPNSRVWSVVKANAYGHGLTEAVHALAPVTNGFAMIEIDKAVALRNSGITHPILLLEGFFDRDDCMTVLKYHLTPVIHQKWQAEMLAECISELRQQKNPDINLQLFENPAVYLKCNTGMNRVGVTDESLEIAKLLADLNCDITLMTHFATADGPQGIEKPHQTLLNHHNNILNNASPGKLPICAANTAAIFRYPDTHHDWVRPGIALYGCSPFDDVTAKELNLKPVMTLRSAIIATQHLKRGEAVGYGALFVADKPTRVGVVACGYADGYPRTAPTDTPVWVGEQRSRILGRVSMDMLCIDLTDINADIGSEVILWGDKIPADEVAKAANTISYELFCRVTARVPYVYEF